MAGKTDEAGAPQAGNKTTKPAKYSRLRLSIGNEPAALSVKTVLAYEAAMRNRTKSAAAYELVMEAIDIDSYPAEVLERLESIEAQLKRRAAMQFFEATDED